MINRLSLIIFGYILAILLLPLVLSFLIQDIPYSQQPPLASLERVYGNFVLKQVLVSPVDNLSGIGLSIKNPNDANKNDLTLSLFSEDNLMVRKSIKNGQEIPDGNFMKFKFDPIQGSEGKVYTFVLSSPNVSDINSAFSVYLTDIKTSYEQSLIEQDQVIEGYYLAPVIFSKPNHELQVPMLIYRQWWENFLKEGLFSVIYLLMLIILAGVFFYKNKN